MIAANLGHNDCVSVLVFHGADVNATTKVRVRVRVRVRILLPMPHWCRGGINVSCVAFESEYESSTTKSIMGTSLSLILMMSRMERHR